MRAGHFAHGLGFAAVDKVMRAQRAGLFFLGGGGGEGGDLRAEDAGELDGQMAQAADAHDAHARGGIDAMGAQRVIDGDAAAEQRSRLLALQRVGNGNDKAGVGAHAVGIAAVAVNAGSLGGRAEILHAAGTPLADAAGVRLPAQADALADFEQLDLRADGRHLADDLVAGNEGILADAPVIGDEMKVAVADAAVGDGDLDLLRSQLAGVILERQQLCSRRMHCKSLNLAHDYVLNPHEMEGAQNSPRSARGS